MDFFGTDIQILIKKMKTYRGSMYLQYLLTLLNDSDIEKLFLNYVYRYAYHFFYIILHSPKYIIGSYSIIRHFFS